MSYNIVDTRLEKTIDGYDIIATTYGYFEEDAQWKGFLVQASGIDTDTIFDYQIDNQIYIKGGEYWSRGGALGDYAECSIVDKDDVLGLFDMYGLVSGVDVLELFKFVESIYLNPDGGHQILDTPDSALVYPGLYLRVKVHTTSTEELDLGCTFIWFEE